MPASALRLLMLTAGDRPEFQSAATELWQLLKQTEGIEVTGVYSLTEDVPSTVNADLVVILGGDGSILRGCRLLGSHQIPIIGVNLGRLGFLADLSPEDFRDGLTLLKTGSYSVVEHLMFECQHHCQEGVTHTDLGLNEVTVTSGGSWKMLDIQLRIDHEYVTTFSCDGLIISTPVGSTAHNLSAGGPILRQELQAFAITPICPHTLTVRPIVDCASRVYTLSVADAPPGVSIVIDGQIRRAIHNHDQIIVRRAEPTFKLVRLPGHSYYNTLHRKLGWHGQLDYRERRRS